MIPSAVIHFASRRAVYRRGGLVLSRLVQPFVVHQDGEQLISDANLLALLDDPVVIIKVPGEGDVLRDLPDDERRDVADRFREKLAEQAEFDKIPSEQAGGGGQLLNPVPSPAAGEGVVSADGGGVSEQSGAAKEEPKADSAPAPVAAQPAGRKRQG